MGPNLPKGKLFLNGIEIGEVRSVEFNESPKLENERKLSLNYGCTLTISEKSTKNLKRFMRNKIRIIKYSNIIQ